MGADGLASRLPAAAADVAAALAEIDPNELRLGLRQVFREQAYFAASTDKVRL